MLTASTVIPTAQKTKPRPDPFGRRHAVHDGHAAMSMARSVAPIDNEVALAVRALPFAAEQVRHAIRPALRVRRGAVPPGGRNGANDIAKAISQRQPHAADPESEEPPALPAARCCRSAPRTWGTHARTHTRQSARACAPAGRRA